MLEVARERSSPSRRAPLIARVPLRPLLAGSHLLFIGAAFLPWLTGGFGARGALTGLDLARVTWSGAVGLPLGAAGEFGATAALYGVPALAADALLLLALGPWLGLSRSLVERIVLALAAPGVLVALVVLAFGVGVLGVDRVDGAAWGLAVLLTASTLAGTPRLV
ncbi:MAG: hypothetical protein GEU80_15825 [Dehalococcoidia bacterium]|nr:hypothetical protein [Dehalococcoidia bacterium]